MPVKICFQFVSLIQKFGIRHSSGFKYYQILQEVSRLRLDNAVDYILAILRPNNLVVITSNKACNP